ncbi:Astacin-like peptidase p16 [Argiope bruennichi]|uniref:Astacin-like peptidase p16 n=1 Tax=Argiope bruennichi TaxID=94029 RepID=A0A8T0E722_ARGBR|nr:Astacin-like peptidase p16 [Argiope bruennichi]
MQNSDLFGGDMLGVNPHDRNAIPGFQLRWPGAMVAYEIDPSLGLENQFTKLERYQNTLLDTFDYNSVMLYGNTAFSKDNKSNTMVAKTGVRLYETYDKPGLSASDVKRVRKMYWCDEEWMKKQKKN